MGENAVKQTIGVLTSGGDAPGMNAAIRGVVRKAIKDGYRVLGIKKGYEGLLRGDMEELTLSSVSDTIHRGGTILGTARSAEFRYDEGVEKGKQQCIKHNMIGLVVIGGDGSFRGASDLSAKGINCIGIPGTIDNDIACTDYTIGYDTAMNTVIEMVDKLRDTSQSHDRCSVVEVMGRRAGHIALSTGIACGASAIIVAEKPYDLDAIAQKMLSSKTLGKEHFIVMVSEGVGDVHSIAKYLEEKTGVTSRATVLGHVQRGGNPTLRDRLIGSQMGYHAVELLRKGIGDRIVAYKNGKIADVGIKEGLAMNKSINEELLYVANEISF